MALINAATLALQPRLLPTRSQRALCRSATLQPYAAGADRLRRRSCRAAAAGGAEASGGSDGLDPIRQDVRQPAAGAAGAGAPGPADDGTADAVLQQEGQQKPAAPATAAPQQQLWRVLLPRCWALVRRNLWPLLVAHAFTDAIVFLLHRLSHRATNEGGCCAADAALCCAPIRWPALLSELS